MIIIADSRQSNKTTKAIILAASTNSILVVAKDDIVNITLRQAREMGYNLQVVSARQFFNARNVGKYRNDDCRVVIDNIDIMLREMFGCEVMMATTTGCSANIETPKECDMIRHPYAFDTYDHEKCPPEILEKFKFYNGDGTK